MRLFILLFLFLAACRKPGDGRIAEAEAGENLSGGVNATAFDFGENAFGVQAKNTTTQEDNYFVTGNAVFRANWITAPASVQSLDGLGAVFNAVSCGSCHFKDGRAQPPLSPDAPLNGLLFRLSIPGAGPHGGPPADLVYGGQLQDKSILNVPAEAKVRVRYVESAGTFADGTPYSLRTPQYEFTQLQYGNFPADLLFSPRIAPQIPGLGLLEIVPESAILSWADEQDVNQDGISGRANYVWDVAQQTPALGRFGWKAGQPNLSQQTAAAFQADIGITNTLFSGENFTDAQQQQFPGLPNGGMPELPDETLQKVIAYVRLLSVPARRNHDGEAVLRGKFLFEALQCGACHRPAFQTGGEGGIGALRNQQIRPYSDLLLHDMGGGLADERPDFLATGREWRTPPLWGIGLVKTVNGHTTLLHDGRARNLEEAILWHGGEAAAARQGFLELDKTEREHLVRFLESL